MLHARKSNQSRTLEPCFSILTRVGMYVWQGEWCWSSKVSILHLESKLSITPSRVPVPNCVEKVLRVLWFAFAVFASAQAIAALHQQGKSLWNLTDSTLLHG
eukprot:1613033-Rhodomonas_salina.3